MTLTMNYAEIKAKRYLALLGIKKGLSGYMYLLDVILYQLDRPSNFIKTTMEEVADKYDITFRNLQNCIQYSLKNAQGGAKTMGCKEIINECIDYIRTEEE